MAKRYENGAMILTSNLTCRVVESGLWCDPVLTAAMLDRPPGIGRSFSYTPVPSPGRQFGWQINQKENKRGGYRVVWGLDPSRRDRRSVECRIGGRGN